jgi:hypothetical protein
VSLKPRFCERRREEEKVTKIVREKNPQRARKERVTRKCES